MPAVPPRWLIAGEHDPRRQCLGFDQPQFRVAPLLKETRTVAQHHWIHQQPILVDETVLCQRLDELRAPGDEDVLAGLLLELGDLLVPLGHAPTGKLETGSTAPGPCMTPSSVTNSETTIRLIVYAPCECSL